MNWHSLLQDAAAVATAAGVIVAARQLYLSKDQAVAQFEDSLNEQYRSLLKELPLAALLGQQLTAAELEEALAGLESVRILFPADAAEGHRRSFRQAMIPQVAYESLLGRSRLRRCRDSHPEKPRAQYAGPR